MSQYGRRSHFLFVLGLAAVFGLLLKVPFELPARAFIWFAVLQIPVFVYPDVVRLLTGRPCSFCSYVGSFVVSSLGMMFLVLVFKSPGYR